MRTYPWRAGYPWIITWKKTTKPSSAVFRAQGDFTNAVALWDYMQRQGEEKFRVLRQMNLLYTDGEIMKSNGLDPRSYYQMLKELQEAFREWQDI